MEPGYYEPVSTIEKPSRRRGVLLILAAMLLGMLLLGGWLVTPTLAQTPSPTAIPEFDLAIWKTSVPEFFSSQNSNQYVLYVSRTNDATVGAPVIVEDQMPVGVLAKNAVGDDWNCTISDNEKYVSCVYLRAITDTLTFPAIIIDVEFESGLTEITNTAKLVVQDNNLSNNTSTITTLIDPVDLEVTKTHSPEIVKINDSIIYTIILRNNSDTTAYDVELTDILPPYLITQSIQITPITRTFTISNNIILWEAFDLQKDEPLQFTIQANLVPSADGKTVTNKVEVSSSNADYDLTSNNAETSFVVGGLDISKDIIYYTDDGIKNWVYTGEIFTYTIKVENISDFPANTVIVYDTIPEGIDVVDTIPDGIQYTESTRLLRYSKGTLSDEDPPLYIQVIARANSTITETTTITNSARVTWYPQGSTIALEEISNDVPILVVPQGALEVTKSDGLEFLKPEQVYTYKVGIKNVGSLPIPSKISIVDTLPTNAELIDYIYNKATPLVFTDESLNYLIAEYNQPLSPNQIITFEVIMKANPNLAGGTTITNTVEARAPENTIADIVSSASAYDISTIEEISSSEMDIVLTVNPTQAKVGENLTFRIDVKNQSGTKVDNVVVTGAMQSVLDYVSSNPATGTTFSANTTARTYTWTIGTLLNQNSRSMTMVWKVNSSVTASNSYEHSATMTWNTNKSLVSNIVKYRVTPSSTLPGTGYGADTQQQGSGLSLAAKLLAGLLGMLGLAALAYGAVARGKKSLWANWFMLAGLILLCGGALFGVAAWGFQAVPSETPQELAAISHATRAPESNLILPAQPTDFVEVWDAWPTPTPQSLPDYPIPEPPDHLNQGPNGNEADSSAMTRIIIPAMGLDTVVKYVPLDNSGWLIGGLKQEVAWMGDTSWPGLGSNTGLAGHVDLANGDSGPFWNLGDLKAGDSVTVHTEQNLYTYLVRESKIVPDSDLSVIEPTDKPQLTLITCTGWDNDLRLYLLRLVVFADLVDVKPLNEAALNN